MGILAIITARKGSKGLACKNFRKIGGVSLTDCVVHKAVELKKRGLIEEIYVSSDSLFLCEQASVITGERYELRCAELSADSVKSIDVVENVLDIFRQKGRSFSDVLIMQPTSPLCSVEDYTEAIVVYQNGKSESLISVCHMDGVNPNGLYFVDKNHVATPLLNTHGSGTRRQDLPELYLRNGAIFMVNVSYMTTHKRLISAMPLCYVMPAERSINIDSYDDLDRAIRIWSRTSAASVLEVDASPDNIACCNEIAQTNNMIQFVNEKMFFQVFSYCLNVSGGGINAAKEYWKKNIYVNGSSVFQTGEDVTDVIRNLPYSRENSDANEFISGLVKELMLGCYTIVLKDRDTRSDDSDIIRSFCEDAIAVRKT